MRKLVGCAVAAVAFVVVFLPARTADAGKGFILITHGDSIAHVADVSPEIWSEVYSELGSDVAIGYKYSAFGVFFLDLWTWDGEYVLYRGDEYWQASEAELAALAGVDELSKPLAYTLPPGLAIIVLGVAVWIGWAIWRRRKRAALVALYDDERYQHALDMLIGDGDGGVSFDEAVAYLVGCGISEPEAIERLNALWVGLLEIQQEQQLDGYVTAA